MKKGRERQRAREGERGRVRERVEREIDDNTKICRTEFAANSNYEPCDS